MTVVEATVIMTKAEAERITTRIELRLSTAAENYTVGMQLIRKAINGEAWKVLGFKSPGAYVVENFGAALVGLGFEERRLAAQTMSGLGMSTRAIAPVLGVSQATASRDVRESTESFDSVDPVVAELIEDEEEQVLGRTVRSLDDKDRTVLTHPQSKKRQRTALPSQFDRAVRELDRAIRRFEVLAADDRFASHREVLRERYWRQLGSIDGDLFEFIEFTLEGKPIPEQEKP